MAPATANGANGWLATAGAALGEPSVVRALELLFAAILPLYGTFPAL